MLCSPGEYKCKFFYDKVCRTWKKIYKKGKKKGIQVTNPLSQELFRFYETSEAAIKLGREAKYFKLMVYDPLHNICDYVPSETLFCSL